MKKFYIVLLFFSVALTLSAQEERSSLLSENRRWTICSWTSPSQSGTKLYYEYVLRGDTTINGIRFKQSYKRRVDGASGEDFRPASWVGQQGDKCYVATFESGNSKELVDLQTSMDFGLKVGDSYQQKDLSGFCLNYEVTAVGDTVVESSTDKTVRKVIHLKYQNYPDDSQFQEVWVEGIGSLSEGPFGAYNKTRTGQVTQTVRCIDGDETLIEQQVATGISSAKNADARAAENVFNLQGQPMKTASKRGVYIHNHHKYIVR